MEKQEAFEAYSKLLRDAVVLLKDREQQNLEVSHRPDMQSSDDVLFNIFRNRSIRIYTSYLDSISAKILDSNEAVAVFHLPALRTLMDIYARFLFLHDDVISHNTKFLKILSYQLLAYHRLADHNMFEKILRFYAERLDNISPDYPRRWEEFEYEWLKEKGFLFPPSKNFLTEEKMKTASPRAGKIFGAQKQREIYNHLSELLHGNPFLAHDIGRARYWLGSMSLGTTAYFLELIDNKVFRNDKRRDFREWLKEANGKKMFLIEFWQRERRVLT